MICCISTSLILNNNAGKTNDVLILFKLPSVPLLHNIIALVYIFWEDCTYSFMNLMFTVSYKYTKVFIMKTRFFNMNK